MKWLCYICFFPIWLNAQQTQFIKYTTADGLPHSSVWCMSQDTDNYIWLGTANGLSRFNGQKFEHYSTEKGLYDKSITALIKKDTTSIIATCYQRGINLIKSGKIERVKEKTDSFQIGAEVFYQGDTLFSVRGATLFYILPTGEHQIIEYPFQQVLNKIAKNQKGEYYICLSKGIYHFKNDKVEKVDLPELPIQNTTAYFEDTEGNQWIGSNQKLICLLKDGSVKTYQAGKNPNNFVHRILVDSKKRIWVSITNEGLYQLEEGQVNFVGDRFEIGNTQINDFLQDHEENVWIATYGKGVLCLPNTPFEHYTDKTGLTSHIITCLHYEPVSKNLFIGTFDKLNILKNNNFSIMDLGNDSKGFQYIQDILSNEKGTVFVNTSGTDNNTFKLKKYKDIEVYHGKMYLGFTIWQDSLILRKKHSFDEIEMLSKQGEFYKKKKAFRKVDFGKDRFKDILVDAQNIFWGGTDNGLYIIDSMGQINTIYQEDIPDILNKNIIHTIVEDRSKNIWIGTSEGVACWNGKTWKAYYQKDGLADNSVTSIVADEQNNIWLGTYNGLSFFDGEKFETYQVSEGLISNEISELAYDFNQKYLWIGTIAGLSKLDLKKLEKYRSSTIKYFEINAIINNQDTLSNAKNIKLPYRQSNLKIKYNVLSFYNPNGIEYKYALTKNGEGKNWKNTQKQELSFSSLAAGEYNLYLKARSVNAQWSKPIQVHFTITKPFWQRLSFFVLITTLLIATVILLAWLRIKYIQKNEAEKRALAQRITNLEQQALGAMMNPHFIFNALNSIQHYMNTNNPNEANEYLSKFAHLIRLNMDLASQNTISLEEELGRLELYLELEELRFGERFQWNIDLEEDLDSYEYLVPSMIIQPYVENAIWHGLDQKETIGKVDIKIYEKNNQLHIEVIDNGIGIEESQQLKKSHIDTHNSKGMKITRERIELFNQNKKQNASVEVKELKDELKKAQGTKVHIRLAIVNE